MLLPSLSLLQNPDSWVLTTRCEKKLDSQSMENFLFEYPCVQIDFSESNSFEHIKDVLLECCLRKGECLNYQMSPFLPLPDYSNQIAEWHFDGISSRTGRVPDWIFLLHNGDDLGCESSAKNGFAIANCYLLYSYLSQRSKDLLINCYQVILGHRIGTSNLQSFEKSDLSVKMLESIATGVNVLRGHIPFPSTFSVDIKEFFYCYPDDLRFYFDGISWPDQQYLLSDIQAALKIPSVTHNHSFGCSSLLAVHNKSCFHSANEVQGGALRSVFRLQLIEAP